MRAIVSIVLVLFVCGCMPAPRGACPSSSDMNLSQKGFVNYTVYVRDGQSSEVRPVNRLVWDACANKSDGGEYLTVDECSGGRCFVNKRVCPDIDITTQIWHECPDGCTDGVCK